MRCFAVLRTRAECIRGWLQLELIGSERSDAAGTNLSQGSCRGVHLARCQMGVPGRPAEAAKGSGAARVGRRDACVAPEFRRSALAARQIGNFYGAAPDVKSIRTAAGSRSSRTTVGASMLPAASASASAAQEHPRLRWKQGALRPGFDLAAFDSSDHSESLVTDAVTCLSTAIRPSRTAPSEMLSDDGGCGVEMPEAHTPGAAAGALPAGRRQ
jgi:hypothetical protein